MHAGAADREGRRLLRAANRSTPRHRRRPHVRDIQQESRRYPTSLSIADARIRYLRVPNRSTIDLGFVLVRSLSLTR